MPRLNGFKIPIEVGSNEPNEAILHLVLNADAGVVLDVVGVRVVRRFRQVERLVGV